MHCDSWHEKKKKQINKQSDKKKNDGIQANNKKKRTETSWAFGIGLASAVLLHSGNYVESLFFVDTRAFAEADYWAMNL